MGDETDSTDLQHLSLAEAERACAELSEQIARARKVLSDYRALLGPPPPDNDPK